MSKGALIISMVISERLDEIICWLKKAENAVQKRSTTELEGNLQELTVSDLFVSIFADAFLMHEH